MSVASSNFFEVGAEQPLTWIFVVEPISNVVMVGGPENDNPVENGDPNEGEIRDADGVASNAVNEEIS